MAMDERYKKVIQDEANFNETNFVSTGVYSKDTKEKLNQPLKSSSPCNKSYYEFENSALNNCLQSSFNCGQNIRNESYGILKHSTESSKPITKNPSNSSKGFENSFKILQHQIESKSFHPCIYSAIENIQPSLLELRLQALQRIQVSIPHIGADKQYEQTPKPLLALLYTFVSKGPEIYGNVDANSDIGLKYTVGIDSDGSKCLKIVRQLLKKEVLCGKRVSQMTRAYDDVEAVTRLLEEKEKDLELTVQIGKELLSQNNLLESRISDLEAELRSSNEDRSQLVHELHKKNELITVLTNDNEISSDNESPTFSNSVTLDLLQKKITTLQDENKSLKIEASQLACQTDEIEAQERELMKDITMELNHVNIQFDHLSLELERQREENRIQHEQIVSLTAQLAEAEMKLHHLINDNDEHLTLLSITKENQNLLALELVEFKERYQEVLSLLQETQDQLRKQRKKGLPHARSSFLSTLGTFPQESLQSELMESSLHSENSIDSGIMVDQGSKNRVGRLTFELPNGSNVMYSGCGSSKVPVSSLQPYKRIFDTVRYASKTGQFSDNDLAGMPNIGVMSISAASGPRISSMAFNNDSSDTKQEYINLVSKTFSWDSLTYQSDENYPTQPSGVPGAPGAKELEAALKRLTPAEILARRAMLSFAPAGTYSYDDVQPSLSLPLGLRTPDTVMSISSNETSPNMSSLHQWRLPEKLQIVKPIEGSQTLHHWSQLATPTLSGLLDERPGVTIRGGRGLDDLGMRAYTLSDVEEDINEDLPCKQFEVSGCTYTYTTSTVMHPDDGFFTDLSFLNNSQVSSRCASNSTSRQPSCPPTPRAAISRKNSCSTFSVNSGLASMLNERGIKAVTPSALNTPVGLNFSATVTPCNSPDGSPARCKSPEPLFGLLSSGADMIRRKLTGNYIDSSKRQNAQQKIMLSRLEKRALRSLRLVEKVEKLGLENIIATQSSTMSQLCGGIANRSSSPMTQLISLKNLPTHSSNIVNELHFNRNQIKEVLQKGLQYQQNSTNSTLCQKTLPTNESILRSDESYSLTRPDSDISCLIRNTNGKQKVLAENKTDNLSIRVKQMQRQKSRRNLKNGQRSDLGTIVGRVRSDLGRVSPKQPEVSASSQLNQTSTQSCTEYLSSFETSSTNSEQPSIAHSFVGTISSLLFSRKGGWL